MSKTRDNFTKKLNKLDDYFILNEEKDYYVIGTNVTICRHRSINGNIFQPFSENINVDIPIFIILAFKDNLPTLKEFGHFPIPLLVLPNSILKDPIEIIQHHLDNYVIKNFKS